MALVDVDSGTTESKSAGDNIEVRTESVSFHYINVRVGTADRTEEGYYKCTFTMQLRFVDKEIPFSVEYVEDFVDACQRLIRDALNLDKTIEQLYEISAQVEQKYHKEQNVQNVQNVVLY